MDQKTLNSLEYPKILDQLTNYAVNDETKKEILSLKPLTDSKSIEKLLDHLDETVGLILRIGNPPMTRVGEVIDFVNRALIGSVLSTEELLTIASLLRITKDLKNYLRQDEELENNPNLYRIFKSLAPLTNLEKEITKIIIAPNEIADNASRKLSSIRKEIKLKEKRIANYLDNLINSSSNDSYLQEKIVTIRNGRYVIPVKSEYKQKFNGAVLDRSSTGATLFIEPIAVMEINNEINELLVEERKEIERILRDLTEQVAFNSDEIKDDYSMMIELDLLFSKAQFGLDINGNRAILSDDESISLFSARHPLIDRKKVVASDIVIEPNTNTLVITGPNTGGKTVTLKTLGLLSLMHQSGLYIPVNSNSKTKIFKDIFADIGDEQSIEQSLSTFSSHMSNIVNILDKVDQDSLVLFDELGAGTDPIEGAALAISILEDLKNIGNLTVATTHYAEIKEYALTEDNVVNASVEFDVNTLRPTYKLLIGLPGKSNAFEIASRLGISNDIISQSRKRIKKQHQDLEDTLATAQNEMIEARDKNLEAKKLHEKALAEYNKVLEIKEKIEKQRDKILEKANQEAKKIISDTKKETDTIYKEIHKIQSQANNAIDNKKLEGLRKEVSSLENKFIIDKSVESNKVHMIEDFNVGDRVYIKSLDREADITNILKKEKKVEINSGNIRIKLKPKDLVLLKKPKPKKQQVTVTRNAEAKGSMSTRLDLRGKTGEEARALVDEFINEALLLGHHKLEIIHGYGTGKVRQVVHDYLKKTNLVESYRLGGPGEGGSGATIITL